MVYLPFSQLEIKDSWYVTGMQGTGSDTSVAKDVFVPDHLMVMMDKPFGYVEPGKKHYGAPSDRVPVVPVVRPTGIAQPIGGAEAMLEIRSERRRVGTECGSTCRPRGVQRPKKKK